MLRIVVFAVALLAWLAPGHAAKRVALVIGNGAYTSLAPTLPNPPRDAAAISAALTELGFTVDTVVDGTKVAMDDALARLSREARTADVVLLFYAGHGIQDQGRNYLAPIDATLGDETDLRRRFIRLDDVLDDLSSAKGARILLLDACRDNDAVEALRTAVTPSRAASVTRGLARVSAADGQLVAFATQPDRVATDGDGENSPFTAALVKHMKTPGIELRTALTRVRVDVATATGNGQIPEVSDLLLGEIYLSSAPPADGAPAAPAAATSPAPAPPVAEALATTPPTEAPTETPAPPAGSSAEARAAWDAVKDTTSVAVLRTFLTHYPAGLYADFATARIAELEAAAERVAALEAEARAAAATPTPAPAPAPEVETATRDAEPDDSADIPQAGGNWFVVLGSFPHADRRKAVRRMNSLQSKGIDAALVDTDDYSNLTDGYYAVVLGPYNKATAQRLLRTARQHVADAYIKAGS